MSIIEKQLVMIECSQYGYTQCIDVKNVEFIGETHFVISDPVTVNFTMTEDPEAANKKIACLKKVRGKILADAQITADVVTEKINELLAIEGPE